MNALSLFSLKGKRALITGAGRGIGRAIAEAYASAGAELILCARSQHELEQLALELKRYGVKIDVLSCDVTDVDLFASKVNQLPAIHIFCNNAGINRPNPIEQVTQDDYDAVMNINLRAAFFANQAILAHMRAHKIAGSIINMSSQMGHTGAANRTLYCASKWGLEGLTKALSAEAGPDGIRVNTICPTFIETPMTKPFLEDPAFMDQVISKISMGRIGNVKDIVGAAIYLASDASSLVTGSAVMVDGGWTAS